MSLSPIVPNHNSQAGQVSSAPNKDGGREFNNQFAGNGNTSDEVAGASIKRQKATRGKISRALHSSKNTQLASLNHQGEFEEEAVYRTIMVDGILFTLRELALA